MQKEGYKGLIGLEREKPCKKFGQKRQKISVEPCQVGGTEESLKKFWKSRWTSQIWVFKKPNSRVPIDRKSVSIDQNRKRLV